MAFIGIGIVVLAAVWTAAIVAAAALSRSRQPVSFAGPIAVITVVALITMSLWFGRPPPIADSSPPLPVVYDRSTFGRLVILVVTAVGLFGGLGALFVFHVAAPRRAIRLKAVWELDRDDRN